MSSNGGGPGSSLISQSISSGLTVLPSAGTNCSFLGGGPSEDFGGGSFRSRTVFRLVWSLLWPDTLFPRLPFSGSECCSTGCRCPRLLPGPINSLASSQRYLFSLLSLAGYLCRKDWRRLLGFLLLTQPHRHLLSFLFDVLTHLQTCTK